MARISYRKGKQTSAVLVSSRERALLLKHYLFLKSEIKGGILYCYGTFQPTPFSNSYLYRIKYAPFSAPKVTITKPSIEYNDDIHMYPKDHSLCLYHKSDLVWNTSCHLYDTIVPWIHEWIVFYELYLISGKWEHPFIPHTQTKT